MTRLGPISSLSSGASGPSVQGWVLPYLINWVETQGLDAASIRKLRGIAELTDPDLRANQRGGDIFRMLVIAAVLRLGRRARRGEHIEEDFAVSAVGTAVP